MVEAFCLKERKKVSVKRAHEVTLKNGRRAMVGVCCHCGTKVAKIMKDSDKIKRKDNLFPVKLGVG